MFEALAYHINMSWIYWGLFAIYSITTVGIIGVVISENRNPVKSLAWITILLLFPLVGIILYIFFGRSIKNTRMISRRNRRRLKKLNPYRASDPDKMELSEESKQQIKLAHSLTGAQFFATNSSRIFTNGQDKFDSLEADLRTASKFIHLQYYIFEDDNTGRRIRDILIERARAGVKVRVIYDHVGSFKVKRRFFKEMLDAGIDVYPFFKVSFPLFATRINWRNHRKICVIDGHIGYIGGMNIADRYIDGGESFPSWRDTHVRITGPAVNALQFSFAIDWNFMGQPLIEEDLPVQQQQNGNRKIGMQVLTSGPTSQWSNIAYVMFKAIANAKRRIYIQTPYFLPTESLLKALQTAALAKVDVRLMIPRRNDSRLLRNASFSYITECLRAGIKIYLYEGGMLHSKTMVVDDEFSTIGSTNFDFRSFEHNFESNLFIYSRDVNREMAEIFLNDQDSSTRITASAWRHRPIIQKGIESVVRLLSPIL